MEDRTLKISKIREGTVLDHVPAGKALKVLSILKIDENAPYSVSIGMRVPSKKLGGQKDVIKIENRFLEKHEVDRIALVAPEATISIVKNYEITEKFQVDLPERVVGIVQCSNRSCISNKKEPVTSEFIVVSKKPLVLRCVYCERNMGEREVHSTL
ncbi:aspartate carbamoyltransferase regulatory subunit [Thermogymnomonas acidicola]|uniref:aspartate carbamoyltransferase regulatory subunit n=1 Tax=Thermogymnomonas acidicola TaxID=399579 RepID=UPI00094655DD|nr:aspartate carbamoyltransferase regulatory subunit [Thermogymnomonas acidicola]